MSSFSCGGRKTRRPTAAAGKNARRYPSAGKNGVRCGVARRARDVVCRSCPPRRRSDDSSCSSAPCLGRLHGPPVVHKLLARQSAASVRKPGKNADARGAGRVGTLSGGTSDGPEGPCRPSGSRETGLLIGRTESLEFTRQSHRWRAGALEWATETRHPRTGG